MKILLFGKNGQVGWELNRSLQPLGEVIALGREDADFSEPESLRVVVHNIKPDFIVNAVAYTAVDKAEDEEELAALINSTAPGVLAEEAFKIGAILVHFSTDYVFDGTKKGSYVEDDRPNPVNAYGRTKFEGEQTVQSSGCDYLIFRTSWVYAPRGHNFLLTVLKLAKERDVLNIVEDQMGSPTAARLIADTTGLCLHRAIKEKQSGVFSSGLYHLASSNYTSWYGFCVTAVKIAKEKLDLKLKIGDINAIPALSYPTKAARPANSQLCSAKLEKRFNVKIPDWSEGLRLCVDEIR